MAKLKKIQKEDIALYRIPGGLKYSPTGEYLAFQVKRADLEKNEYHSDVWLARGGEAKQATWSIDASVVDWKDEHTLILRRNTKDTKPGTTDLYLLDVRGGEAAPWVTVPFGLGQFKQIDATHYIATGTIRRDDPDAYKDDEETRKKKAEAKKAEEDYHVADELPYWFNGAGYVSGTREAVFALTIDEKGKIDAKRLTAPEFDAGGIRVEGRKVYFTGSTFKGQRSLYNKVFVYDADTNKIKTVYGRADHSIGGLFEMGGKLYGFASDMKTYGINQTSDMVRIDESGLSMVYRPEVSLYSSVIGDTAEGGDGHYSDGREYLTFATIRDHNAIFRLRPNRGKVVQDTIWEQDGMLCSMDVTSDSIAVVYQGWDHVAEVFVMDREGKNMQRLTHLNDEALEGRYIAKPNRLDYTSCGMDMRGWVLLPENYSPKKKYPAILDVHGGPRCAYGETFFHEMQYWAAEGFIVFFTNIKGSDGRGDDFADIRGKYGVTDFQNLMDFTDAVLAAYPNIDKKKLCETGGSYGGFMTNWIIGHTDRFCACASQRSISNWVSFSFISDIGKMFGPDQCGAKGMFGEANYEKLWDRSPLKYADRVKTPTLFLHSDEDYRCPLPEGMQMMQALAARGIETRLIVFKGENHELSRSGKPKHRVRRLDEITEWFKRHTR